MNYAGIALSISFLCVFASVQLIISYTTSYWFNLTYLGTVLLSCVVMHPICYIAITWAIFPYSSWIVKLLNH